MRLQVLGLAFGLSLLVNSASNASTMSCTVKGVYSLSESGELVVGGGMGFPGAVFTVDLVTGQVRGPVLDNVSSSLCKRVVLKTPTNKDSFKVLANCGNGTAVEYLEISTWDKNQFVAKGVAKTLHTGTCVKTGAF